MSHTQLSMSRLSLALACSYGFRPDVPSEPREVGRAARIGSITHKLAECFVAGQSVQMDDVNVHELAEAKGLFESLVTWLNPRRDRILHCEIGLRYDAARDVATRGPRRGEPGYDDIGPSVLPGTLDLILRGADGVLEVVDLKTGKKQYETPWQLYGQAVAASRLLGESVVRVGYVYPRKTRCAEPEWETLDEDRLDEEAGRIAKLLRVLPVAEPQRGDHCWRCSSRAACPAWQADVA